QTLARKELKICLREFGDFQTPPELVALVLRAIYRSGNYWERALEPTCGAGNFLIGLRNLVRPPTEIQGIEIQPHYALEANTGLWQNGGTILRVHQANLFAMNLAELSWSHHGN